MRITDEMRFPHPVLNSETTDFAEGEFSVQFQVTEDLATGTARVEHEIVLTEPAVLELVSRAHAIVGCFIRCNDTYYTELRALSWPKGRSDFAPGSLLNRVQLRPLIWLKEDLRDWNPDGIHYEFEPPVSLKRGDVLGIAPEHVFSAGQAKFSPIESIFELRRDPNAENGKISIDLMGDRIAILAAPATFDVLNILRGQLEGLPVVMNATYVPAVMEVLDLLRDGVVQFEGYRWLQPFMAKCDAKGIDPTARLSILESAQALLNFPGNALAQLVSYGGL